MFRLITAMLLAATGLFTTPDSNEASLRQADVADNIMFGPGDVFQGLGGGARAAGLANAAGRVAGGGAPFAFGPLWSVDRLIRSSFETAGGDLYNDFYGLLADGRPGLQGNPFASDATGGSGWDRLADIAAPGSGFGGGTARPGGKNSVTRPLFDSAGTSSKGTGSGSGGSLFPLPGGGAQVAGGRSNDGVTNGTQGESGSAIAPDAVAAVPLPATLPLLAGALGLAGAAGLRRRRRG
ncbi:hypothetical protein E0K89_018935 [Aquicoccus sp. SCR17]|nr:hypothetical protein [Carideicomes alvinocaridis]